MDEALENLSEGVETITATLIDWLNDFVDKAEIESMHESINNIVDAVKNSASIDALHSMLRDIVPDVSDDNLENITSALTISPEESALDQSFVAFDHPTMESFQQAASEHIVSGTTTDVITSNTPSETTILEENGGEKKVRYKSNIAFLGATYCTICSCPGYKGNGTEDCAFCHHTWWNHHFVG